MTHRAIILLLPLILLVGCVPREPQQVPTTAAQTPTVPLQPVGTASEIPPSPTEAEANPTLASSPTAGAPAATQEPSQAPEIEPLRIAYTGPDENLWLVDAISGEQEQLTQDAASPSPDSSGEAVQYCCAQWTTDRTLLGYRRDVGTPVSDGYRYWFELWVYDALKSEHRLILEDQAIIGFVWKPLTHLLVYGLQVDMGYFAASGGVSKEMAEGIWAVDADGGEPFELVPPSGGYWLVNPEFSRDGRFLSFEEVIYLEGRGNFAYYDFEEQAYLAWERGIGNYDWSPDGQEIVYDNMLYLPTGTETIFASDRLGEGEREVAPPLESGYAFYPTFSPKGDQIVYLAEEGGFETSLYTLYVQPFPEGKPQSLGVFEQALNLAWLPDGSGLVFSAGPWGSQQVLRVTYPGGEVTPLADGSQPRLPQLLP
jgi:hypothetical protein